MNFSPLEIQPIEQDGEKTTASLLFVSLSQELCVHKADLQAFQQPSDIETSYTQERSQFYKINCAP